MIDTGRPEKGQCAVRPRRLTLKGDARRPLASARLTLMAAVAVAGSFAAPPATAGEYSTFQHLEISSATPGCRSSALLNRPANWQADEGAVVLLTLTPLPDAVHDAFVAELLSERVAVLERVPAPCDAAPGQHGGVADGMRGARDVLGGDTGPVVAIGYGPGNRAMLEVLREHGGAGSRYSAAASIGEGAPVFLLGAGWRTGGQAGGLAPLCRALTAVAAGMGASMQHDDASAVAEACRAAMANEVSAVAGAAR